MNQTAALPLTTGERSSGGASKRAFALHFGEMVLVMFVGMGVLGGLAHLLFAAAGSSLSDQSGGLRVMLMGVYMTVPMVLWMRYRGHDLARNIEMAAAMVVPSVFAAVLAWAGAIDTGAALAIQHAVMVPAMLGVMLWRYDEYSRSHFSGASRLARLRQASRWRTATLASARIEPGLPQPGHLPAHRG